MPLFRVNWLRPERVFYGTIVSIVLSVVKRKREWVLGIDRMIRGGVVGIAIVLLVGILLLDVAAMRWGFDSLDKLNSPEWERRRWRRGMPL